MRQTKRPRALGYNLPARIVACAAVLAFLCVGTLFADIDGLKLAVSSSPPLSGTEKLNGGAVINLDASWTRGDTPPFSATFESGGATIGNSSTNANSTKFITTGAALGNGAKSFGVKVIETSVPNANEASATGDKSVEIDLVPPQITVSIAAPPNGQFSNVAPNNVVTITVSANKDVQMPQISISPDGPLGAAAVADPSNVEPGRSFRYTITLSTAQAGVYTVRAVCQDTTVPAASANTGAGQSSFNVNTAGPSPAAINTVEPAQVTKSQNITLKGTAAAGMTSVTVFEGGTAMGSAAVSGGNWAVSVTGLPEGQHTFTARGVDALGNQSADSAPFSVKIDLTAPQIPVLTQPKSPTNAPTITITGTNAIDPISAGVNAPPVYVAIQRADGTDLGSGTANPDGTFSFPGIALNIGENRFWCFAEDSAHGSPGNKSAMSNLIIVMRDDDGSNVDTVQISRSPSLPAEPLPIDASSKYIGAGNFTIQVRFNKDMDSSVNPTIGVTPQGGAEMTNNSGSWTASTTFVGSISIPSAQGAIWDGPAALRVFGAKDLAGNTMVEYNLSPAFAIDTTSPVTTMDSTDPIYVASGTTSVPIKGTSHDDLSGVGYLDLIWEPFTGGASSSVRVPIFNGTDVNVDYMWNVSTLASGKYKFWLLGTDQAKPAPNSELMVRADYRLLIIDRDGPNVDKICLDDFNTDIDAIDPTTQTPTIGSDVTKLTAVLIAGSVSDLDLDRSIFTLHFQQTNTEILGNKTHNSSTTMFLMFPKLTENGTYSVSVTALDKAGNSSPPATRSFVLDTAGPSAVTFVPPKGTYANETLESLAADQIWALLDDVAADYVNSTIEVIYNGITVGNQVVTTPPAARLEWDILGATDTLPLNQSYDGRWDVIVTPKDIYGNTGAVQKSFFYLDTIPPAISSAAPVIDFAEGGTWIGLADTVLSITLSDAPKDTIAFFNSLPAGGIPQAPLQQAQDATWQNGAGSGVDVSTSSFVLSLPDGTTTTGTNVAGTTRWDAQRPASPGGEDGMVAIRGAARTADKVTEGTTVPNIYNGEWNYNFDYRRPSITFSAPVSMGKYCKKQLTIGGGVADNGTNADLQVISAQYSLGDTVSWASLTAFVPTLPAKAASVTQTIDISNLLDGTHTLYGRCTDRGRNLSYDTASGQEPYQVRFVVDRTPPAVPTLVLPLNDVPQRTRSYKFKWSKEADADSYLLQIADDASFNNVLNHQAAASYSGLLGQVTVMTEASFSVPKDGTYFWRVAAIEDCLDGYNISSFSVTWRTIVDSVKPKVLEIQPSPSTSNKITTGMVTFTIRFSEPMDTTIQPVVSLTSNGGQMMLVEQLSYRDNTWTGTTVIPKDNSPLYDGNAVISITGAADLAGNIMENDATNVVVINTGPAFETKIFSNPAHEFEIMIVTRASEALQGPPACSVTQSSVRVPVVMNFLKEKFYAGSYKIDYTMPGKAYIDVSGTDLHGMVGRGSVEFVVADLTPTGQFAIQTEDGAASLKAAPGSVDQQSGVFMISRQYLESTTAPQIAKIVPSLRSQINIGAPNSPELLEITPLEEVGPANLKLKRCMLYTAKIGEIPLHVPSEKVHLYRLLGNKWIFAGGEIKDGILSSQLAGPGRLALMADLKEPTLAAVVPSHLEKLDTPQPMIEGQIVDGGSGVELKSIGVFIDGVAQEGLRVKQDGNFTLQVANPLAKGRHQLEIQALDLAGNTLRSSLSFVAPGPFTIDQLVAYPSPARGNAVWITYNLEQRADEIRLKIYDVAGHKVAEFETFDFPNLANGKIRWDMRNDRGKTVANGVYLFKFEATKNGKTLKQTGKLAVLR